MDPQQLFKRFSAAASVPIRSTGLGLGIEKKIVDTHHLSIAYTCEEGIRRFCIDRV